ncbi:MAG TPA: SRPBCC family protein [Jatrophihabitans sp.]|jgi:carbon monoxide dehydrogenase subunit G|uniref:SRPBCC family protein n=1 Tax=Jatrophihabitans sp. TaxID=1932789 RepID=UPI002EDF629F
MRLTHDFTVPADIDRAWEVLLDIELIAPCMPGAALETVDGDDFTGTVKVRLGPIGLTYKGKASFIEKDAAGRRAVIDAQGKDARGNGTAKAIITATLTSQGSGTAVNVVTDLNITGKPAQFGRGVMVDVGNKLIGQFADCLAGKLSEPAAGALPEPATGALSEPATGALPEPAAGPLDPGELDATELEIAEQQLGAVEFDNVERLGIDEPGIAETGLAELRTAPSVMPDSAVAGPGLASASADGQDQAIEPAAAAEAAPPAQRLSDAAAAAKPTGRPVRPDTGPTLAQPPAHRPAVADVEPIDLLGSAGPAIAKRLAPVAAGALLLALLFLLRRHRRTASRSAQRQAAAERRAAVQRWAAVDRRGSAERRAAAERRGSVEQRQLDRHVLWLGRVLGQPAKPAPGRSAVLGRPRRSRRRGD